jgi:uncharacterized membrane protein (Fun14 family)
MSDLLSTYGPSLLALAPSFLAGWLIGKLARKAMRTTLLVTGLVLVGVYLAGRAGFDAGAVEAWVRNASSWAGENIEGAQRSLAALLPSAGSAAAGGFLGFGGRRRRRR